MAISLFTLAPCRADVLLPEAENSHVVTEFRIDPALRIIDTRIEFEMQKTGTPGAALLVVRDGRIIHARGYGLANAELRTPVDVHTVWPIASITKLVTAIAAMQLVESGDLSLHQDINTYVKRLQVPDKYDSPITLGDLLRHTSGLDELPGRRVARAEDIEPFHEFMSDHLVQYRAPGTFTSYSSYGMALAGLLVEEVTGLSYVEYVKAKIFDPLGMTNTWIMSRTGDEAGVAVPYELEDGKARRIDYEWYSTPPVASAVSSSMNMGGLLLALTGTGPKILSELSLRAMMTTQATLHPGVPGWGYGFQLDLVNGRCIAEHGGDIGGFASLLVVAPNERFGFFIVHHGEGSGLRYMIREDLFDMLFPSTPLKPEALPGVDLTPYAGSYRASFSCHTCGSGATAPEFDVSIEDGSLWLWGSRWVPVAEDMFIRDDGRSRLAFVRDGKGQISALSGGSWRVGERMRTK